MELTPVDWAWVAGLLEGEGCFPISNKGYPRITLQMTDEDIVTRFANYFGYKVRLRVDKRPNNQDTFAVSITKASILHNIVTHIYKHLGTRRRAAIDKWYEIWGSKYYPFKHPNVSDPSQ